MLLLVDSQLKGSNSRMVVKAMSGAEIKDAG